MNKSISKIEFGQAVKMLDAGYYIMHVNWLLGKSPEIYRENRDCSHFLVAAGQDWRNINNTIILVIADAEAEENYLASRAGLEKYGEQDRTYEELIIENQLLKKAVITFLHDSASPLSSIRGGQENVEYWVGECKDIADGSEHFEKVKRIGNQMIRAIGILNNFYRALWRVVDRRDPPNNDELRNVISDMEKLLK